jgi:hypothetical protein
MAVAPQPRPRQRPCYQVYMLCLTHPMKGWNQITMSTGPTSA